jgi:hypothetical protein
MQKDYPPQNLKRGTAAQQHACGAFGIASGLWGKLTDQQWWAWHLAAKKEKRRRHWTAKRRLTPQNLFTEINSQQAFLGLQPFMDAPERPGFIVDPLGPLIAGHGPHGATLKLVVPKVPAGHVLVFGARPCSPGRRYCDKWKYLGLLPAPSGGVSDISLLYYQVYGVPRPGSRVIIATQQQLNGWRDMLRRLDVVIPVDQGPATRPKRRRRAAGA